jgi:hypothetical protein
MRIKLSPQEKQHLKKNVCDVERPVINDNIYPDMDFRDMDEDGKGVWRNTHGTRLLRQKPPKRQGERFFIGNTLVEVSRVTAQRATYSRDSWVWVISLVVVK